MESTSPLDRDLQRKILLGLRACAPYGSDDVHQELGLGEVPFEKIVTNLLYLAEHGLIEHGFVRQDYISGQSQYMQTSAATITADGLDFLEDDGGLSAILGVVTVRLHDDTIKSLIEAKILASDMPQPDKKRWLDQLRSLPADATKHLVLKLVDLGLDSSPSALRAIGKLLGLDAGA